MYIIYLAGYLRLKSQDTVFRLPLVLQINKVLLSPSDGLSRFNEFEVPKLLTVQLEGAYRTKKNNDSFSNLKRFAVSTHGHPNENQRCLSHISKLSAIPGRLTIYS